MELSKSSDNFYEASGKKKRKLKRVNKRIAKKLKKGKKIPTRLRKRHKNLIAKRKKLLLGAKTKKGKLKAMALLTAFGLTPLGILIAKKIKRNRATQNKVLIAKGKKPISMTAPVTKKEEKLAVTSAVIANPAVAQQVQDAVKQNPALATSVPTPQEVNQYGEQEMASQVVEEQNPDVAQEVAEDEQTSTQEIAQEYVAGEEEVAPNEEVPSGEDVESGNVYGEEEVEEVVEGDAGFDGVMQDDQIFYDIDNSILAIDKGGDSFADGDFQYLNGEATFSADADFFYADANFFYAPDKVKKPFKDTAGAAILKALAVGVATAGVGILAGQGQGQGSGSASDMPSSDTPAEPKKFPVVAVGVVAVLLVGVGTAIWYFGKGK